MSQASDQYVHYKKDLLQYSQLAFDIPFEHHMQMLQLADEEQPPIIVLSVTVIEAEDLEAKDANGFSDPYCMLGIRPVIRSVSPQPGSSPRPSISSSTSNLSQSSIENLSHDKFRKHSFKLSFKRKDTTKPREQRDSLSSELPAKFIRATSVKPFTLNPKWNEMYRFDIDDINCDSLHLDIWDHDDESSVLEAVSKLNEVRGVRGLGRYFKQVCQSARQSSQDDFLGCVTIPIKDIPSTGLDGWFTLEARSHRSSVQGRIRLKLSLSTRENQRANTDEDNWTEMIQHENLCATFIDYELRKLRKETWKWNGDLPRQAETILHQHALQGDLTDLQIAMARFAAASKVYLKHPLEPRWLQKLLSNIEAVWFNYTISREEEMWLSEKFTAIQERLLQQLRHHRQLFPALNIPYLNRLENILRCLAYMSTMKAFWKCCPFNKEIRGEIVAALRKGTPDWFANLKSSHMGNDEDQQQLQLIHFLSDVYVHCHQGLFIYHRIFESTNGIPYFSVVFKQIDKLLSDEVIAYINSNNQIDEPNLQNMLSVYLWVKDVSLFHQKLPSGADHRLLIVHNNEWFQPFIAYWITITRSKAVQRVHTAIELQKKCENKKFVVHSTSCVDVVAMFSHVRDFWNFLQWPPSIRLLSDLVDCICATAILYGDLLVHNLVENGFFTQQGPFEVQDDMCLTLNNLDYIYNFISLLDKYFDFAALEKVTNETSMIPLNGVMQQTLTHLHGILMNIVKQVYPFMQENIRKSMFHLAWSPDTLPIQQALDPLLDYLQNHFNDLNVALVPANFHRILNEIWSQILDEFKHQMESNASNTEYSAKFYERLHSALELLVGFFHAEGAGLRYEVLHSPAYNEIQQCLHHHKTDTRQLIEYFYMARLQQQLICTTSPYGTLTVRAYFNHESLCVEVLHAKDIIPLDPNGFSDPFVILELLPQRVFPNCSEQRTNVHKRTLNPVFDECFEFSVTSEQCHEPGSMIAFTVMDHDVITANDFAGEAFLALSTLPGLTDALGVDNFHGLKSIELILTHQNKNDPILKALESRANDRIAVDFVRRQKPRCSTK